MFRFEVSSGPRRIAPARRRSSSSLASGNRSRSPAIVLFELDGDFGRSFPSGHASSAAFAAMVLSGWDGPKPERHHDFIDVTDFPDCWRRKKITVEVEAKAKELAVEKLRRELAVAQ